MGEHEFKKIVTKEGPIIWGYPDLMQLGDEYLLTNSGILIDNKGNLVWSVEWEHYFSQAIYIKDRQVLLTNRTINFGMGGDFHLGIACIDMKTGEYKWKHFYDQYESKLSLRKKQPDINMVRGLGSIDVLQNCVCTDGFRVNLEDGSYVYTGEDKGRIKENENILPSKPAKSCKNMLHINDENTSMVNIKVNVININGQDFSKEGYFFNKCDFVISTKEHLYFFGVPEKKNLSNTILLKYSRALKKIEEEIEMPFRNSIDDVYNFFQKGVLIIAGGSIWLAKGFNL